jgi:hypothetical protein
MDFLRGIQEQLGVGGGGASSSLPTTAPAGGGTVPAVGSGGNKKAGLLADWQSYSHDVEGGGGGAAGAANAAANNVAQAATDLASNLGSFFQQQYARVADTAAAVASGNGPSLEEATGLPSTTQLTYFAAFLGAGLLFLSLAVFVFLPMIILTPAKFALTFTLGCVSVLAALASLRGWKAQLSAALQRDRLPFTAGYAVSVLATLYAALVAKSYLLSLGCSAAQAVALCYYVAAYFPGGVESVRYWLSWVVSAAGSCARGLFSAAAR